ncbi:hypothetical protein P5673_030426, partial [Acropora cervicornis]
HGKAPFTYGCVNRSNNPECLKLSWHSLPIHNAKLLRTWLRKMKINDPPVSKLSSLCSEHFSEDCFISKVDLFSFSPAEKPKRKAPIYHSAAHYGSRSVPSDKAEAVKSKELLMEQLKEKEEEVKHLTERLEFMFYRFKELDIFPDRQIIELHKPECFKTKYEGT